MTIKAVAFDVFGTLVRIERPLRPFRKLVRLLHNAGRHRHADDGARVMSNSVDLRQAAEMFDGIVPESEIRILEAELDEEIRSITVFDDVAPTLRGLKERGIKIALCSNLAAPYGPPVLELLPYQPDFCAWSYEAKAVKPQPAIYQYLCEGLACRPDEVLMVGDTPEADMHGPREFGMHGFLLDRNAAGYIAGGGLPSLTCVIELIDELLIRSPPS